MKIMKDILHNNFLIQFNQRGTLHMSKFRLKSTLSNFFDPA